MATSSRFFCYKILVVFVVTLHRAFRHRNQLSKRLLYETSASEDAEKSRMASVFGNPLSGTQRCVLSQDDFRWFSITTCSWVYVWCLIYRTFFFWQQSVFQESTFSFHLPFCLSSLSKLHILLGFCYENRASWPSHEAWLPSWRWSKALGSRYKKRTPWAVDDNPYPIHLIPYISIHYWLKLDIKWRGRIDAIQHTNKNNVSSIESTWIYWRCSLICILNIYDIAYSNENID